MLGILFKKFCYDKIIPTSDIMTLIHQQAFKKVNKFDFTHQQVILGNALMIAQYKQPGMGYAIATKTLLKDDEVLGAL